MIAHDINKEEILSKEEKSSYAIFCKKLQKQLKIEGYDIPYNIVEALSTNMDEQNVRDFLATNWIKKFSKYNYGDYKCTLSKELNSYRTYYQKIGIEKVLGEELSKKINVSKMYAKRAKNLALYIDQKLISEKYKQLENTINKRTEFKISISRKEHPNIYDFSFPKALDEIIICQKHGLDITKDLKNVNVGNKIIPAAAIHNVRKFYEQGLLNRFNISVSQLIEKSLKCEKYSANNLQNIIKLDNLGEDVTFYINALENDYIDKIEFDNYLKIGLMGMNESINVTPLFESGLTIDEVKDIILYTKMLNEPDLNMFASKMISNIKNHYYYVIPENAEYINKNSKILFSAMTNMKNEQLEVLNNIHTLMKIKDLDMLADISLSPEQMKNIIYEEENIDSYNINKDLNEILKNEEQTIDFPELDDDIFESQVINPKININKNERKYDYTI